MQQLLRVSTPLYTLNKNLEEILFPALEPYDEGFLQVDDLHSLWYAQYGNPNGVPVIVLHGGPGIGCGPNDMRYFDPKFYRIINLDQRGAKRSKPFGETLDNNTQNLIADIEQLRAHLKIAKWLVFGGSWGSALSLLYGEAHPEHCLGFVLRGIFLARKADADNLWYGMRDIFPEAWDKMYKFLPENERDNIALALYKRIMDPDPNIHLPAALAFMDYDLRAGVLFHTQEEIDKMLLDHDRMIGSTRMFSYYYHNNFFIRENQILEEIHTIKHLPLNIVHGRYDIICRLSSGYALHQAWPGSELLIVQDSGHTTAEPGIAKGLVEATEKMKIVLA